MSCLKFCTTKWTKRYIKINLMVFLFSKLAIIGHDLVVVANQTKSKGDAIMATRKPSSKETLKEKK